MLFSTFTATSEEYTLSGVTGKFTRSTNAMESTGTSQQPATVAKARTAEDEQEFFVSATESIHIYLDDERLLARGSVTYQSDDTHSTSDLLMIDERDEVLGLMRDSIDAMPEGEPRRMVLQFIEALEPEARLVLLRGNVRVERDDSDIQAAWMLFDESDADHFISVADSQRPLQLRVLLDEDGDAQSSDESGEN